MSYYRNNFFHDLYEMEDYMYEMEDMEEDMDEVVEEVMDEAIEEIAESMSYMLAEKGWVEGKKNPMRSLTVNMKKHKKYDDILKKLRALAMDVASELGISSGKASNHINNKYGRKKQGRGNTRSSVGGDEMEFYNK